MDHVVLNSFWFDREFSIEIVKVGDQIQIQIPFYDCCGALRDHDYLVLSPLTWQCLVDGKNISEIPVQKEPIILNNSLVFSVEQRPLRSLIVVLQEFRMKEDFSRHFLSPVCIFNKTQWTKLYLAMNDITECVIGSLIEIFFDTLSSTVSEGGGKDKNIESKLADSMYEISCDHFKTSMQKVSDCYAHIYKRYGYDSKTLNSEKKFMLYKNLAWCNMDFQQLAREFISKNENWADYMKQFLLDTENFKNFTEKVENMCLTSSK
ncbi:hypothetical protein NPIL_212251 [Nephila pilipes]|uniref:Uncharacterized protein n=1 Tax=Nephila pilipes TaxID=299642 RepID=A0A8X6UND0_NEPPI|nr:hypothetical protein NPIL_212251 [Nephila pilipes]